jgi:hypothetical protein
MLRRKVFGVLFFMALSVCLVIVNDSAALAQEQQQQQSAATTSAASGPARDEADYDVQLDLLVASNNPAEKGSTPQSLDAAIRQLRTSLPFAHYRLATTFLNRVKDGGTLETRGVGNSLMTTQIGPNTPTFYDFAFYQLKQDRDIRGQALIRIPRFKFNLRLPIITGTTLAGAGNASSPIINYESVGMSTEINIREAVPTLVGTFATGRPDELLLLLISVKQNSPR